MKCWVCRKEKKEDIDFKKRIERDLPEFVEYYRCVCEECRKGWGNFPEVEYRATFHHIWCNEAWGCSPEDCDMCKSLKKDHPEFGNEEKMMEEYFPNNKKIKQ